MLFVKIEIYIATGIKFFNIRSLWTLWNMVLRYHILLRNIKFDSTIKIYVFNFHAFRFLSGAIVCNRILHESFLIELCPAVAFFRPMPTHSHNITSFQTSLIQYRYRSCSNAIVCVNYAKVCVLTNNFHHLF